MYKKLGGLKFDAVLVLLVFLFFALSAMMTILLGGKIYRKTVSTINDGSDEQTALLYIWTKVKAADTLDMVFVDDFCGQPSLYLLEDYDGVIYKTVVYYYDGWVYELFFEEGLEFSQTDGMPVMICEEIEFHNIGNMISVSAGEQDIMIYPRSKRFVRSGDS